MEAKSGKCAKQTGMKLPAWLNQTVVLQINITIWKIVLALLLLIYGAYVAWEIYWYRQVGLYFIKWHTHIVFTTLLCFLLWLPFLLFHKIFRVAFTKNLLLSTGTVALLLVLFEIFLVITGMNKNYMEQRSGYYQSPYDQNMGNYYNIRQPQKEYLLESGEFSFTRVTNSLGYSDGEWKLEKDTNVIRIAALGDSFTEGDGAPADSAYPVVLSRLLNELAYKVEVFNAGISGSDPFFGYKNFTDIILPYQPDIVLQTVSSDDMLYDISLRGGFERFGNDSLLQLKKAPWWEPVAAASYLFRALMKIAGLDIDNPGGGVKNKQHVAKLNEQLQNLIIKYDSVAAFNNVKVIWLIKPLKHEFKGGQYVFDYTDVNSVFPELKNTIVFDLLPCYLQHASPSSQTYSDFYWIIDGHHNSQGYHLMAQCIAPVVAGNIKNRKAANALSD